MRRRRPRAAFAPQLDLLNNITRESEADRFRLILNDLGAGLALMHQAGAGWEAAPPGQGLQCVTVVGPDGPPGTFTVKGV